MFFLHGLGLGLATAVILGPVFFTLLRNAILKGPYAGLATALGILLSDITVLTLCYYLSERWIQDLFNHPWSYLVAALILFTVGLSFLLKKITDAKEDQGTDKYLHIGAFFQGFVVNFANPFVFAIWIGFITLGTEMHYEGASLLLYFVGILLGIIFTDSLKALFAQQIKRWLNTRHLQWLYRLIGIVLILFALRLALTSWV